MTAGSEQRAVGSKETGERRMRRTLSIPVCLLSAVFLPADSVAQQPTKVPRIGYLSRDIHPADSRSIAPRNLEAFRQGLRELGYIEGKTIIIDYRFADGRVERLAALAQELIGLKAEILVVDTTASARAAKKVTSKIPIVIASGSDPIRSGLVVSLAQPGGNVTGLTNLILELLGKRLEILKEVVPKVSRFAFLDDDDTRSANIAELEIAQKTAGALGARLDRIEVKTANPDFDGAFRIMAKEHMGGLISSSGPLGSTLNRKKIIELAQKTRMPAIYSSVTWINDGGLMYYGVNTSDNYRRTATYVDKILKGAKPADLPIEAPMKFELAVNLQAAKQIGLTIPPNVLARADRVIR
jgi:putative ABC transport system substrate-binding protein